MNKAADIIAVLRDDIQRLGRDGDRATHAASALRWLRELEAEFKRVEQELRLSDLFLGRDGPPARVEPKPTGILLADDLAASLEGLLATQGPATDLPPSKRRRFARMVAQWIADDVKVDRVRAAERTVVKAATTEMRNRPRSWESKR